MTSVSANGARVCCSAGTTRCSKFRLIRLSSQPARFTSKSTSSLPFRATRSKSWLMSTGVMTVESTTDWNARIGGSSAMRPACVIAARRCSTCRVICHACTLAFMGQAEYLNGSISAPSDDQCARASPDRAAMGRWSRVTVAIGVMPIIGEKSTIACGRGSDAFSSDSSA